MSAAIGVAVSLALGVTFMAAVAPSARAATTEEMVGYCTEMLAKATPSGTQAQPRIDVPTTYAGGICWGYADAMFTAFAFQTGDGAAMLGVCKPQGFRRSDLVRLFLDYVARHPDAKEHQPAFAFYWAAYEAFPCGQ
jgi:hypothetical protein